MGLRCLLGHDFGEPETERERNEEGNEVVVTVREVKTCRRCGEKQVVSENKEIKSIDQLRESATGDSSARDTAGAGVGTDEPTTTEQEPAGAGVGTAEPAVDGTAEESSSAEAGDQWSAEELDIGESPSEPETETEAEPESESAGEPDDVDRGVAEIIESAEKDDEMLKPESAESEEADAEPEAAEGEEETPVHPAERGDDEAESETSAHEDEDAVILDDESPPEEGREQWDEAAHPEEVPGRDNTTAEPRSPDDEDAVIMGGDEGEPTEEPEPEPEPEPAQEQSPVEEPTDDQPTTEQSASDQPTAVESEDAEIMGSGTTEPEPEPEPSSTPENEPDEEPASQEPGKRETTDEGHMPWPEAPGEDEGHDAEAPDGEPADVDFGGGLTPQGPDNEQNGAETSESAETTETSAGSSEPSAPTQDKSESSSGGRSAPEPNINLEQSSREAGLEYYCSECGLTRDVGNSSMRAGDICPDCRKGYITERQKAE